MPELLEAISQVAKHFGIGIILIVAIILIVIFGMMVSRERF